MIKKIFTPSFLFLAFLLMQTAAGQDSENPIIDKKPQETDQSKAVDEKPKLRAFEKMMNEISTSRNTVNRMFGNLPIGFPDLQEQMMVKINELKAKTQLLQSQVHQAAFEAYIESPNESAAVNSAIAIALNRSLKPLTTSEKFDPKLAIEIASAMIKNGVSPPQVYFAAFRGSYAIQDFERAKLMLDKIKETQPEINESFYNELAKTQANWNRELMIRRQESVANDLPQAEFDTSVGKFTVELFENHAPIAVANFISLAEQGYYDGNTFHLVKPGILARTGCKTGDGTGNPGYFIPCECYQEEIRHHFAGSLSMGVENATRDTGGSKFFITHQPNNLLDGKHTVFGRVLDNMDAIHQLNTVDNTLIRSAMIVPSTINKVTILRKRDHAYVPKKLPLKEVGGGATSPPPSTGDGG